MLHFLAMADNRSMLRRYLRRWGGPLRGRVRIFPYGRIGDPARLPDGTYVFCDVDRLPPSGLAEAGRTWSRLAARGDSVRLLNDPSRVLRRRELLRTLHDRGINRFNAFGLDEPLDRVRFPAFVRSAREHTGPLTPLIPDRAGLTAALAGLAAVGHDPADLLVVEFLDTAVAGEFRKFSVFRAGDAVIAQHVFFGSAWMVKGTTDWQPDQVRRDNEFMAQNPHRAAIEAVFRLANITYGRADYGLLGDDVQIWEVNTNPTILLARAAYDSTRMPGKQAFADSLNAALLALDDCVPGPGPLSRAASLFDLYGPVMFKADTSKHRAAVVSPAAATEIAPHTEKRYWNGFVDRLARVTEPLAPGPEDIRRYEASVADAARDGAPVRALLLGVTGGIATMRWPAGATLLAVDRAVPMVAKIWPTHRVAIPAQAIVNNWEYFALRDRSFTLAIGDGSYSAAGTADDQEAVSRELTRVLVKGGRVILRLFVSPPSPESVEAVLAAMDAGTIGNFSIFKWRFVMAHAPGDRYAIRLGDVFETWKATGFTPASLAAKTGWPEHQVASILDYRDSETRFSFPPLAEALRRLTRHFDHRDTFTPSYELGERCPIVVLATRG